MKDKKLIILIISAIVVLFIVGCWFLLRSNDASENYIIKQWSNFAQRIDIEIADKTIISSTESIESSHLGVETGGSNTIFTITGLRKGNTTATVKVFNSDGIIESSKKYYFEVSDDLKVKLVEMQENISSKVNE